MDRHTLTPTQQAGIESWMSEKASDTLNPLSPDVPGTNLVYLDQLEIDHAWWLVVLGGGNGLVYAYVPDWDVFFNIECVDYVTDRAGPNGETMPVIDPVQMEARLAAKAGGQNPKHAAHGHHVAPRTVQDFLAAQTPETRKALEEQLKKHHLLHGKH